MRIERLALTAFGPFTDQVLDLSGGAPGGVHVVFGPNEAGKTTALRAVIALLFGIPEKTQDAHLHPYGKLRLGAELSAGAQRLCFVRLKRRKNDLLDEQGQPLDPGRLAELLSHLDQQSFTRRFGLDQAELELGAKALLGGAEEGLFAAGTAGAVARRVLDGLVAESDGLFRPRGKNPRLNRALGAYADAVRHAKQLERPPEKWVEQKQAQEAAEKEAEALRQQRPKLRAEHTRLRRLSTLLSDVARLEQVDQELAELGDAPRLGVDAEKRREAAQDRLRDAELRAQRFTEEKQAAQERLAALPEPSPLLDIEDEHPALRDRLARERSARQDLPKLVAKHRELEERVARVLGRLAPSAGGEDVLARARELLPDAVRDQRIQELFAERASLDKELELSRKELLRAQDEIAEASVNGTEPAPALDVLAAALADARAQRGVMERVSELAEQIAAQRVAIDAARHRLGLPREPLGDIPTADELREAADRWRDLTARIERWGEEVNQIESETAGIRGRLDALRGHDTLPSEQKLHESRARRDELVARIGSADEPAAEEVTALVRDADEIVDRLRREAGRIAEAGALEQQLEGLLARQRAKTKQQKAAAKSLDAHRERLIARSPGSAPLETAAAYQAHGQALLDLAAQDRAQAEAVAAHDARQKSLAGCEAALRQAVADLGPDPIPDGLSLAGVVQFAETRFEEHNKELERLRERRTKLERATQRRHVALHDVEATTERLAAWKTAFEQSASGLALDQRLTMERVRDVMAELSGLREILTEARGLDARIAGMKRDAEAFREDVRRLVTRHAPTLVDQDPIDAAEQLLEQIASSRRLAEERKAATQALTTSEAHLREARSDAKQARAQLEDLMREAGVADAEALREVEGRSRRAVSLDTERASLRKDLLHKSSGRDLDELRAEARGTSHHELETRIDELTEELEALDKRIHDRERDAESYAEGLKHYGSEDVAWARQRAAARSAEARALLSEFLTVRTARVVLERQIAQYADRFAGPIARRASELFARLTLGGYSHLSIGMGERTIRLVRGTDPIEVTGLSRGTRAQLYLALRLASLENHFEQNPTVPLVLDDLFIDFDDERARAAFEVLGELAQRVQILYFTHLGRDVEAARRGVPHDLLFEHTMCESLSMISSRSP